MEKTTLRLQPSESVVVEAASRIFAAYISSGRIPDGSEGDWIERSVREAIQIACNVDAAVRSDDEVG